ncbi:MAG TPA: response regulator [Candidatus Angelobacter sp.]
MDKSPIRILVVDDYEPWRRYLSTTLGKHDGLQVVGEVSDGLEAVQKAQELQPDLILLDIGLPTLNGIEAARQIRKHSPGSKILFVSENRSADIANEALSTGAGGYVVKSDAASELLPAIKAVFKGKRFVSASVADPPDPQTGARFHRDNVATLIPTQNVRSARHHEVAFYSDEASFLNGFTQFIAAALKSGNAVIVVATESHRDNLLPRLQAQGLNIGAAIEQGRYIALDVAQTLSTFMVNGLPDPVQFSKVARDLVLRAAKVARGIPPHVAACGECAPFLWEQGNADAAVRLEQLWDNVAREFDLDILCGYRLSSFQGGIGSHVFEQICVEHSAVHTQ